MFLIESLIVREKRLPVYAVVLPPFTPKHMARVFTGPVVLGAHGKYFIVATAEAVTVLPYVVSLDIAGFTVRNYAGELVYPCETSGVQKSAGAAVL